MEKLRKSLPSLLWMRRTPSSGMPRLHHVCQSISVLVRAKYSPNPAELSFGENACEVRACLDKIIVHSGGADNGRETTLSREAHGHEADDIAASVAVEGLGLCVLG